MATVVELKAQAKVLKIKGYSRMLRGELIEAIDKAASAAVEAEPATPTDGDYSREGRVMTRIMDAMKAESDATEVSTPTPAETKAQRREAARAAGARGVSAHPMINLRRVINYRWQNAKQGGQTVLTDKPVTPAQSRRMRKKSNRALRTA